ncbi:DoxX family protein [Aureisphaera galaxeae]|uniref:DoxX family protein n=1 Tax=Aureisphaera galaxeae TaxID=1538023 RepID=UPI0023504A77|nr:DoxX family protein [Aureisphaera galaxeae]MDC8004656.1 DoxX family protein [Aureisphaera galaxeae]
MNRIVFTIAKGIFALHFFIFGLNKFLLFANVAPPEGETAQLFLGAMFSTFLAKFVGATEIIGAVLLMIPRTSFLGALICLPVTASIVLFHLAHDMPGNGIWLITFVLMLVLLWGFKDELKLLITKPQVK